MKTTNENENQKEEESLLTFLERTRDGKYAKIDLESLSPGRVQEEREETLWEEQYYYSVS